MADNTIDTLNIQIGSSTTQAVRSINNLVKKLDTLNAALGNLDISRLNNFSNSLKSLGSVNFKANGLNAAINAINRLGKSDFSQFDTGKLGEILTEMQKLDAIPDVSPSVSRFTTAIAKLAGTGQYIGNVSKELPNLATGLKDTAEKINTMGEVSTSLNGFITSLGKLASSGDRTRKTASQLSTLAQEVLKFFDAMKNAPKISEDTIRMTQALAQLASSGGKTNAATNTIAKSFDSLSVATNKAASLVTSAGSKIKSGVAGIISAFQNIGNSATGINKVTFGLGNLVKMAAGLQIARKFVDFGKSAVTLGSDITEVENVVDVAFGSMADKAYEFASTATEKFGLSELAAKNYSGTMMAMLKSSGVAQKSAAEMSTTLAGLAGDLASFFNIDTDTAFYKLRSGISGEIEPLKQLGINLSVANLQSYALSQGITTSYNSMSQAEKVLLRYNYILSVTGDAQGDFARTSGTWANQVRLLTLNLQSLAAVLGQGIIAGILPAIQALNAFISKLMQAANAFRNFMYVLMGKKIKGSTSGVVNDLAGLEDTAADLSGLQNAGDDASSGLDNATDSAKKLKKALSVLPFDQLNQLTDNSNNTGTTSGKKGNSGIGGLSDGLAGLQDSIDDALNTEETPINKWATKIRNAFLKHDWEGLGKTIADMLNIGMQKIYDVINWKKVGPKITQFTDAFTRTFNSLVDHINWDLMGRTVGAGITTLAKTFNLLTDPSTGINFEGIGKGLSMGLRGIFNEVPWSEFGNALGNGFMISWRLLDGFVQDMSRKNDAGITGWQELGTSVAETMNGIFEKVDFSEIAHALATGLNGAFDSLAAFTETFEWDNLVDNITNGIVTFMQEFNWRENGQKLEDFINHLLTSLISIAEGVDWESFGHNVGVFLSQIDWGKHLSQLLTVIGDVLGGIWEGLGTTSAGTFVQAMAVFAIGDKLMPLVDTITKFFTGDTVFGNLSKAVQGMLSPAITEAVATTIPALGTSLGSLVATGGGIALAVAGAVLLTKKLAGLFETMQGGNGMTTQYGGYLHDYATQLTDVAKLTNDQSEALWDLIEKDEELGKTHDEMYSDMVEKLKEYGVSADQAKTALEQYGAQAGVSADFAEGMTDKISALGDGMSEAAGKFDTSKISISDLKEELYLLSLKSDEFGGLYKTAMDELDNANNGGTITNTKDALDAVYTSLKNAGVPLDELDKKLREDFPNATVATKTAVDKNIVGAQQTISSSVGKASADTKAATGEMAKSATDDFSEIQKQADTYMKGMETTTTSSWGNSSRDATLKAREMKNAVSEELGYMDESVRSHFKSQYSIAYGKWQNMGRDISSYISRTMSSDIGSALDGVVRTIQNKFGNLYSTGQNAMQQLANGMRSVTIQTPHMYMDIDASVNGTSHSYRWNSGINWCAKGGLFSNASVIGVGEAGQEAVLPLENRKAMKSIADSIMSGYDGNLGLTKKEITEAVERGVVTAMMNNGGFGGSSPEYIMNSIKVNERELARIVTKAQNNTDYRMNPSPAY